MTPSAAKFETETALQRERRIFGEEIQRLRNCFLNKAFDLTAAGSRRRNLALTILFLLLGAIIILRAHPLTQWAEELSHLFQYLFNPVYTAAAPNAPAEFISFALGTLFEAGTLRFLPVFLLPFIFALQAAAEYLTDIFELPGVDTAREFILQVAFSGGQKAIRIGGGEVLPSSLNSPIYLIGGPGKVVVELDTVAVFEKPNGQPHVLGPTVKGGATLEGFERFRQALDLRDLYTDPLEVKSRSLDGIPVSANDVRMLFSIWREGKQPTTENPHPFSQRAVETLVYGQTCNVILDGPYPSECNPSWPDIIQSLIRIELDRFMAEHPLAEYLASIGQPEVKLAHQQEEAIAKAEQGIIPDDPIQPGNVPPAPLFQARHVVTSLFSQFAQDFTARASDSGLELKWIGIGTWKTPNEIIPEKHLEAWRLSRENLARGSQAAVSGVRNEARLQHTLRLIQTVPLARFQENVDTGKDHAETLRDLLIGYREQFIECRELLLKSKKPMHDSLDQAIKIIESAFGHWVGGVGKPPAAASKPKTSPATTPRPIPGVTSDDASIPPADPEEEDLYQDLLKKVGQDPGQVEELIENERKRAPQANRKEWMQQAINHWPNDDQ